jgi:hypothetical protein
MRRDIEGRMRRGLRKGNRAMRAGVYPLRGHGGEQATKFPPPTRRSTREGSEAKADKESNAGLRRHPLSWTELPHRFPRT